jgi:hypothetical protein
MPTFLRRRPFFLASFGLAGFAFSQACDDIDNFDVSAGGKATIAGSSLLEDLFSDLPFSGFDEITFDQQFKNQGVTEDQVDSVRLTTFTLTIESPASGTFDFLEQIDFYAESPNQPKVRIARAASIPPGAREIALVIDDVELAPYVTAEYMTITTDAKGRRPDDDTTLKASLVFDVDARLPGC